MTRSTLWVASLCTAVGLWAGAAQAADLWSPAVPVTVAAPVPFDPGNSFEGRFGVFAHGVGSVEQGTVDVNGSLLTPRLNFFGVTGAWSYLIPRAQLGGALNISNRTSFVYLDALWTIPVWNRFFVEGFVGPAIHNGSLGPTATHAGLGCDALFHAGGSIGYQFSEHWNLIGTFEHLSNGRTVFGVQCGTNLLPGRNQGLNNYGIRVGYSF